MKRRSEYATRAERTLRESSNVVLLAQQNTMLAGAQIEATLALAEEQRTANILAMIRVQQAEGYVPDEALLDEAKGRLGL